MNHRRNYGIFTSILAKTILLMTLVGLLASCEKSTHTQSNGPLTGGYSVLVNQGHVLVSGFKSENGQVSPKFWIDGQSAEQSKFEELLENQSSYRQAVDREFRKVYGYKDSEGAIQSYQFDQGSLANEGKIFYYKNNAMVKMDNDSIGTISSVAFYDGAPFFGGYLGKITSSEAGSVLRPLTPFVWDGHSPIVLLSLPAQTSSFQGISTIYKAGSNEFYVGGLCGVPMYWKNSEPVVLDERYGEVWQITKSGSDVYAVGLINKHNSNSTGHTACYWKNGTLYELQDNAQAYGISLEGDDIYVSGAIGNVPSDYKACYWKNGERVDLQM